MKRIVLSVCAAVAAAVAFVTVAMGAASDYQQVEYLGLTGKQYFRYPFKNSSAGLGYCTKFRMTVAPQQYGPHIISSGSENPKYWVACRSGDILFACEGDNTKINNFKCSTTNYPGNMGVNVDMTMAFNTNADYWAEINGKRIAQRTATVEPVNLTQLYLCSFGSGGNWLKGRFYGAQLYTNGVMFADFRPCFRLSDRTPGLYETLDDKFYENVGTDSGSISFGPDVNVRTDVLQVTATPNETYGFANPAYGTYGGLYVCEQRELTAAGAVTNATGTQRDALVGWKLYRRTSPTDAVGSWTLDREEAGTVCHYQHPDPANLMRLEWNWSRENNVTAIGADGLQVAPTDQWVADGETATVRATMSSRKWFVKWGGDVPFVNWLDNPLTLTVTKPMQITSEVVGRSYGYGNWLTTTWATIASGVKSLDNFRIVGRLGGDIIPNVVREGLFVTTNLTAEGVVHAFQLQVEADFLKCAIGEIRLTNDGLLQARATEACYASKCAEGSFNFYGSPSGKKPGTLVTKAGGNGYGIQALQVYTAPPKRMGLYLMLK